ncbi:MAG: hypothetical protein RCG15_07915 [Candidatus Rickettsia vulgarisii]
MMPYKNYQEIAVSLDNKINILEKKIEILDRLSTSNEVATKEDIAVLDYATPLEKEEIALILEYKAKSRGEKGENYQSTLIVTLDNRNRLIEKIKCNITDGKPFVYDVIMNTEGYHCTPIHLIFDKDKLKIFTIDAADAVSLTSMQFLFKLDSIQDVGKEIKAHAGSIQKDNYSCAIFSIQDLNTMSKLGNTLGEYLPEIMQPSIETLHPRFVKHAQSTQTISKNLVNPRNSILKVSNDKYLKEFIDKYSINIEEQKKRNYAITYKTLKYLKAAQKELNDAFKAGGDKLVEDLIKKRTGGIIFEEEKYHFNNTKIKQEPKDIVTAVERLNIRREKAKSPQLGSSGMGR